MPDGGVNDGPHQPELREQVTIFQLITPLLQRWKVVAGLPLTLSLLAIGLSLLLKPRYEAITTFTADLASNAVPGGLGGLASFANQFGITGLATSGFTPDFFAEVIKSQEILRETLLSPFHAPNRAGMDSSQLLLDILAINGDSLEGRINAGLRLLSRSTTTRVDRRSGLVVLSVELPSPRLAADVANRMVELLNQFNLERRQSQSRAQRRFAGERLDQAARELQDAESQNLRFLQANRRYADSPLLAFEANRLQRQVQLRQEVYVTLSREYEQARIFEVRDTPVLTIIDPARVPDRRSFPRRKLLVVFAVLFGGLAAAMIAFIQDSIADARQADRPDYRAWRAAWKRVRTELPWVSRKSGVE